MFSNTSSAVGISFKRKSDLKKVISRIYWAYIGNVLLCDVHTEGSMFLSGYVCFGMISKLLSRGFRKAISAVSRSLSHSIAAKFITSGCYWLGVRTVRRFTDVCNTVGQVNFWVDVTVLSTKQLSIGNCEHNNTSDHQYNYHKHALHIKRGVLMVPWNAELQPTYVVFDFFVYDISSPALKHREPFWLARLNLFIFITWI